MTLVTRKPTGAVPAPNILAAGEEKAGKTYAAASLAASDKVGRVLLLDIGEGCADQYAPLGDYEVVEHDGTLPGLARIASAIAELPGTDDDGRPNVVIVDSVSRIWELCKDHVEGVARTRQGKKAGEEVNVTMDLWNRARSERDPESWTRGYDRVGCP